jgi:hypothetical protein
MHLNQLLNQRQPDSESAVRMFVMSAHLRKEPEDTRQLFGRNADAIIGYGDDCPIILAA